MTPVETLELNDLEKRHKIGELCRQAWDHLCLIVDHEAHPVDRLAAASQAYGASGQATTLFRELKRKRRGSASFELSRLALGVVNCIEARLYRPRGTLCTDSAELIHAEWLLTQVIEVLVGTSALRLDELRELQDRVCKLRSRAEDHLTIVQQADRAKRALRKLDLADVERWSRAVAAGLEDVDFSIEMEIRDAKRSVWANSAMTRITSSRGKRASRPE